MKYALWRVQNRFYWISIPLERKWHALIVFISNCILISVKWQKLTIRFSVLTLSKQLPYLTCQSGSEWRHKNQWAENILRWLTQKRDLRGRTKPRMQDVRVRECDPSLCAPDVMVVWHPHKTSLAWPLYESEECQGLEWLQYQPHSSQDTINITPLDSEISKKIEKLPAIIVYVEMYQLFLKSNIFSYSNQCWSWTCIHMRSVLEGQQTVKEFRILIFML